MSGALGFIAGAGLITLGILTRNLGLVVAGASLVASTTLAVDARQQGVQQETAGQHESLVIQYGRTQIGGFG